MAGFGYAILRIDPEFHIERLTVTIYSIVAISKIVRTVDHFLAN